MNLSGSHYGIADWLIVLGRKGYKEEGTYAELKNKSVTLQEFEVEYESHIDLIHEETKVVSTRSFQKLEEAPLD